MPQNASAHSLAKARKMDGVSTWGQIKEILIQLAWGGTASPAVLTFIFCWNEGYWTARLTTIDAATLSKLIEANPRARGFVLWPPVSRVHRRRGAHYHSGLVLPKAIG